MIKNFGLFWETSKVNWYPGKGKGKFRLPGRRGKNLPGLRVADFRHQQGIYILYGKHGAYYVGLTKRQGLGKRLRDHLADEHEGKWDRFSWFGFRSVLKKKESKYCELRKLAKAVTLGDPATLIADIEALLICAMRLDNTNQMSFSQAAEWKQVASSELATFLAKLK